MTRSTIALCIILTMACVMNGYAVTETVLMQDVPAEVSYFGYACDADANRAIVGAYWDSSFTTYAGAAYIFEFDGTQWNQTQKIGPDTPEMLMWFGNAVAIDGEYAAVGAMGAGGKGAVYIFQNDGTTWTQIKKLEADDGEQDDFFGFSIDLSGMEVLVGAYWDSPHGEHSGSAYQFCGGCGGWQQEGRFIPDDGQAGAEFGYAVAIQEHHVMIGAPFHDGTTKGFDGKLYYYHKDEDQRSWELVQEIESPYPGGRFGHSLAVNGIYGPPFSDMQLVVGAPDFENETGAVNVYQNTKGTWDHISEIIPDIAPGVDTDFGWSVDIDNMGTVVVGLPRYNGATSEEGAAAVYVPQAGDYTLHELVTSDEASDGDNLGWCVSTRKDRVFAGAFMKSTDTVNQCGALSVFDELMIPTPVPTVTPTPDPATPTPTVTPTATPAKSTGVTIDMPKAMFAANDICSCTVTVNYNEMDAANGIPLFVILDVFGTLLFAPDFSEFAFYSMDLVPGDENVVTILPEFNWPEGAGAADNIYWYAGMTNPEMSALLGDMDSFEFGWE